MKTRQAKTYLPAALRIVRKANQTVGRVVPDLAASWSQLLLSTPRRFTPRDWELAFEAIAKRSKLKSGLSVLTAGDGPAVALVHGWEGRATQFAELAPAIIAAGFRVVAIDGPAHGQSEGLLADPYRFSDAIEKVAQAEGPLHGIVGHSMGGSALAIAISGGLSVRRAVSIASPASLNEVIERYASLIRLSPRASQSLRRKVREQILKLGHSDTDIIDLIRDIGSPAMIIHAKDDAEVPFSDAERLSRAWPHAKLIALDGVGHRRILRDHAAISATVEFLSDDKELP